jgi:hypothetical protein
MSLSVRVGRDGFNFELRNVESRLVRFYEGRLCADAIRHEEGIDPISYFTRMNPEHPKRLGERAHGMDPLPLAMDRWRYP